MKDPIERQDAINAIEFGITYARRINIETGEITDPFAAINKELMEAVQRVKALPSAQPEQQWIPCSEGLPEVHETGNSFSGVYMQSYPVLVYGVPEGEEECGFHVVTYCDDLNGYTYWSTELDIVTIDGVRAWMPMPEPYAERREE